MRKITHHLLLLAFFLIPLMPVMGQSSFDGYALYNELNSNNAYLIDKDLNIAHSWNCAVTCNYAVLLKPNGNIVRGGKYSGNQLSGAAVGGMVQELDANANVVWEFIYSTADHVSHHDMTLLPNGNVILTAWETKTNQELQAIGYTGNSAKWPTHLIEVQQNGNGGQIVWEWHIFDHLIQDTDANKPNYGVIGDHPELMDINVPTGGGGPGGGDWFHVNGVDYNETLDQIAFSSRFLSEIFIIDHSTSTQEAASHAGGNAGMGGDFLYRWGNADNYDVVFATQDIPGPVHDVRWIDADRPNGGYLQFFNNQGSNGNSTVDAINPPLVGYNYTLTPGSQYGPTGEDWRHNCLANASGQSASNRMPNGNTFVNLSGSYMYEVDSLNQTIWQYSAGPAKAFRYLCSDSGIVALLGWDPCGLVGIDEIEADAISLYPNPSNGTFELSGLSLDEHDLQISVYDIHGRKVQEFSNVSRLDLSLEAEGVYFVRINIDQTKWITKKVSLLK